LAFFIAGQVVGRFDIVSVVVPNWSLLEESTYISNPYSAE
jgi:hypothetical protein